MPATKNVQKVQNHKGGSLYEDITNLAIPFGLLLTAHGVGYVSNKVTGMKATKTPSKKVAKKTPPKKT